MGFFDKARDAKVSERGTYFEPGSFRVKVRNCKTFTDRKSIDYFVVELEVMKSSNQEDPIGQVRTWMQKTTGVELAFANIKAFAAAASGIDLRAVPKHEEDAVGAEIVKILELSCEDGHLNGKELLLDVKTIITKDKKQEFNVHSWSATPEALSEAAE